MKTLQNNFTTPEQSKRLLKLGVPADSADGYYTNFTDGCYAKYPNYICYRDIKWWDADVTPSWSVGRLMEIISRCYNWRESCDINFTGGCLGIPRYTYTDNYIGGAINFIIKEIENVVKTNNIDFSKLEE